jgi:hypothetical protein
VRRSISMAPTSLKISRCFSIEFASSADKASEMRFTASGRAARTNRVSHGAAFGR